MKNSFKIFESYRTNSVGIWYFVADNGEWKKGKPCKGFGTVKYAEGSVYTGDLYYDGKNFNKIGFGQQDFSRSCFGNIDKRINEKKYKFVGRYDYRKTDWIYGNGVMYYTDACGKPTHFAKGFFTGVRITGDYRGTFDYSSLLDGYTAEMEFDYDSDREYIRERFNNAHLLCERLEKTDTLFIGDSYFDFLDNKAYSGKFSFYNVFPQNFVNCGIGGSRFCDWIGYMPQLKRLSQPDRIIINLGFNDLHFGKTAKQVYADYLKFLRLIRELFPQSEILLMKVVHSPKFSSCCKEENEFNALTAKSASRLGVTVADWNGRISACAENCFHADGVHPNETGYRLFTEEIKRLLSV
jgi:lysophospholipase L1-like esterase